MALKPDDDKHAAQIAAGTHGRRSGHLFEKQLTERINRTAWAKEDLESPPTSHLIRGNIAKELIRYVYHRLDLPKIHDVRAEWTGGAATVREAEIVQPSTYVQPGRTKSKSDVILTISDAKHVTVVGVSTKVCTKATPTNAQLFFTTATAFCKLLRVNGIQVPDIAEEGLRMFCGDVGYRPRDLAGGLANRPKSDPDRWFWEEMPHEAARAWERILGRQQDAVTRILLRNAYVGDPTPPDFVLHGTTRHTSLDDFPAALFSIEELIQLSRRKSGFTVRSYRIRKGRFKEDPTEHQAPRFGFIQFQRGGQKQHPTQLQFNLEAGYFNRCEDS